jgi:ATP-dependent Clp protease ATP-binding subunit ClpA
MNTLATRLHGYWRNGSRYGTPHRAVPEGRREVRKMDASVERQLDPARRSIESRDFEAGLRRKIVGQDEAVQAVVDLYQVFRAGLNSPRRPVGNLLFLGPTGAGKTRPALD